MVDKDLWNQILESIDEEYCMELERSVYKYNHLTVYKIMEHMLEHYADIDNKFIATSRADVEKELDMTVPIDV